MKNEKRELLGYFGVDSGQVMITDPCYIEGWWEIQDKNPEQLKKYPHLADYSLQGACKKTLSKKKGGMLGKGSAVVSSTGYGDGEYKVYATKKDGCIKKLEIEFF
jgi:hypothetical protein